jgi:hypothetical protein
MTLEDQLNGLTSRERTPGTGAIDGGVSAPAPLALTRCRAAGRTVLVLPGFLSPEPHVRRFGDHADPRGRRGSGERLRQIVDRNGAAQSGPEVRPGASRSGDRFDADTHRGHRQ